MKYLVIKVNFYKCFVSFYLEETPSSIANTDGSMLRGNGTPPSLYACEKTVILSLAFYCEYSTNIYLKA